ncbi:MAG: 50S ribosomal protein L29 [Candidatus Omnitrophota bacterium]
MKREDFSNLTREELLEKRGSLQQELHKLNYQRKAKTVEKPHLFFKHRKDIARIETILSNRTKENDNGQ